MNITAYRPRFSQYVEPVADLFLKIGLTPNQISVLSLLAGFGSAWCYFIQAFPAGSLLLFLSAVLDLIDGSVARKTGRQSDFGAVFDWIVDKYVDALVLLAIGLSGVSIIPAIVPLPPVLNQAIVGLAITGSLMNTFIKPVTYAEIGFKERVEGKIDDPLEGIGFFGRPETLLVLIIGGLAGYIGVAVLIVAACTNLSAIQRVLYLYSRYG